MNRSPDISLRAYQADDEDASIALWLRTWQVAYPSIDFATRVDWWRERWRSELLPVAAIVIAETGENMVGFVTIDAATRYLDQLVVAPEYWGSGVSDALIREAKRLSPTGIDLDVNIDNARALAFYDKCGFGVASEGKNPITGRPIYRMSWRP